jgi:hypothetical protein
VDEAADDYESSTRLHAQLGKVQRLLEEMWTESEVVMRHVSEVELRKKKQLIDADRHHSQ